MKRTFDQDLLSLVTDHMEEMVLQCAVRIYSDKATSTKLLTVQRRNLKRYAAFLKRWSKP